MPDFKRLLIIVLTLVVVTAVAAGLLAVANMLTAPAITRQQEEEHALPLKNIFPRLLISRRKPLKRMLSIWFTTPRESFSA